MFHHQVIEALSMTVQMPQHLKSTFWGICPSVDLKTFVSVCPENQSLTHVYTTREASLNILDGYAKGISNSVNHQSTLGDEHIEVPQIRVSRPFNGHPRSLSMRYVSRYESMH